MAFDCVKIEVQYKDGSATVHEMGYLDGIVMLGEHSKYCLWKMLHAESFEHEPQPSFHCTLPGVDVDFREVRSMRVVS